MRLKDKVCVITGGGSGIGESSAKHFARAGARVCVVDRDRDNGGRVVDDLIGQGHDAFFVEANVADVEESRRALEAAFSWHDRLDVVFNNAGVSAIGDVVQCSPNDWDRVMQVNVRGVYLMCHHAVPIMRRQGHGVIINMSSTIAEIGLQSRAAYAASKGAVLALTRSMAADHSHENIRVCALLPGTVYTPFVEGYLKESYADNLEQAVENLKKRQLNGELMTADDVAQAAVFLASDEARFALGTGLVIDGGVSTAKVF